jgi:hypothetical protein
MQPVKSLLPRIGQAHYTHRNVYHDEARGFYLLEFDRPDEMSPVELALWREAEAEAEFLEGAFCEEFGADADDGAAQPVYFATIELLEEFDRLNAVVDLLVAERNSRRSPAEAVQPAIDAAFAAVCEFVDTNARK